MLPSRDKLIDYIGSRLSTTIKEIGHTNIVIAGHTGVGKTTLINAIFGKQLGATGKGKKVTTRTKEYSEETIPVSIFDTQGIETQKYAETRKELYDFINRRNDDTDSTQHIHIAWVCILEDSARVEDADIELVKMLHGMKIPVIVIITKSHRDNEFYDIVCQLLPHASKVIKVLANDRIRKGEFVPSIGLEDLVEETINLIPIGHANAFIAAQHIDIEKKRKNAEKWVNWATGLTIATIVMPPGFSNFYTLAAVIGMIIGINTAWGFTFPKHAVATLLFGVGGFALVGGGLVAQGASILFHVIPVLGPMAAGVLDVTAVKFIGRVYLETVTAYSKNNAYRHPLVKELVEEFKRQFILAKNKGWGK